MHIHNAYLSGSAYLKRVSKRKVKVRLHLSKSWKVRLCVQILCGNPVLFSTDFDPKLNFKLKYTQKRDFQNPGRNF